MSEQTSPVDDYLLPLVQRVLRVFPAWKVFAFQGALTAVLVGWGIDYTLADGLVYLSFNFLFLWLLYRKFGRVRDTKIFVYRFAGISVLLQLLIFFPGIESAIGEVYFR